MKNDNINYIDITLKSFDDSVSKFNDESLNEELGNYILRECSGLSFREKIVIRIKTQFEITKEQKQDLVGMIRENFGLEISEKLDHVKYENIKKLLLMIAGIIFVLLSEIIPLDHIFIIEEVLLIIGWVAIWEAIDSLIFVDIKRKFDIKRLKQLTTCKIEFI